MQTAKELCKRWEQAKEAFNRFAMEQLDVLLNPKPEWPADKPPGDISSQQ